MELIQDFGPSDPPGQAQTFGLTGAGSLNGGAKKRGRGSGGPKTLFANKINASQSPSSARPSPRPAAPARRSKKAARRRGPGEAAPGTRTARARRPCSGCSTRSRRSTSRGRTTSTAAVGRRVRRRGPGPAGLAADEGGAAAAGPGRPGQPDPPARGESLAPRNEPGAQGASARGRRLGAAAAARARAAPPAPAAEPPRSGARARRRRRGRGRVAAGAAVARPPADPTGRRRSRSASTTPPTTTPGPRVPRRRGRRRSAPVRAADAVAGAGADATPLFQYPPGPAAVDSIVVTRGDVDRLEPDEFLNDNLVDLYVKVLVADAARSRLAAREGFDAARLGSEVHAFSSHFFTKLQEEGLRAPDGKDRAYDRVERWTRGVDVFSKKFLVVPIVEHLHWSLAIVCHPGALVRVVRDRIAREEEEAEERARGEDDDESDAPRIDATAEPSGAPPPPRPCIIFMDSLKMHSAPKVERFLRAFLELEWAKRKPDEPELKLKLKVDLPLVVPKVPMQTNSCDCGVYVLRYAEFLSRAVGAAPTVAVTEAAVDDKFAPTTASWFTAAEVAPSRRPQGRRRGPAVAASASA
ncbi:hypothetical protein JL720_5908 [Aureococcus anophagefferens]|nr:hypothetical protein JL720_5908 [Aureococcus anophagefferens]